MIRQVEPRSGLELVESALGCGLGVFECLRFAVRDQFLAPGRTEQLPADDGGAGAIGRQIEHQQLVVANHRVLGVVGADELRIGLPGDFSVLGHDVRLQMKTQIPTPAPSRKPVQTPAQYSLFTCKPPNTNKKEAKRK